MHWLNLSIFLIFLLTGSTSAAKLLGEKQSVLGQNDEEHQKLAEKAIGQLNAQSNDLFLWGLASIDDVHQQMVNGVKYTLKLTLAKTDCTKQHGQLSTEGCKQGNSLKKCTFEVVHRSWENYEGINLIGCEEPYTRSKRHSKIMLKSGNFVLEELRNSRHIKSQDYVAWNRFIDFADKHDKQYANKRDAFKRFRIFKRNLKAIRTWQSRERGSAVYGVNQFADMSTHEWKKTYLPYEWDLPIVPDTLLRDEDISKKDIPESFDWREKGAVTDVKNQGACGSCWAFSTTGNVEGQWFIAKHKLISLSEQQLVDCDDVDQGCNGGLPSNAYKQIISMGGLEPEEKYPYDGRGETCHLSRPDVAVYINGSVELPKNEESMKAFLVNSGPISIGINANTLQFYRHGIIHPWKIFCEPFMLNHGVLIVGYGTEKNKPYWIVKNSWGEKWGETGYYRIYRGKNICGIREMATSAVVL